MFVDHSHSTQVFSVSSSSFLPRWSAALFECFLSLGSQARYIPRFHSHVQQRRPDRTKQCHHVKPSAVRCRRVACKFLCAPGCCVAFANASSRHRVIADREGRRASSDQTCLISTLTSTPSTARPQRHTHQQRDQHKPQYNSEC